MNQLSLYNFGPHEVRELEKNGEPWFVAKDVCQTLGIVNHKDAISDLADDERGSVVATTLGGQQELSLVNEPGLYRLVFRSRKPEAETFKRWIAHEVLPAIRREGVYRLERANSELKDESLALHRRLEGLREAKGELEGQLERKGRPLYPFERARIEALGQEGWTTGQIAKQLKRGPATVRRYRQQVPTVEELCETGVGA